MIGVIFSMDTITYSLTSFVFNFIPEHWKNFQKLVAFGTIFFFFSMLLTGPCPGILENKPHVFVIMIGILIGGIGGALINNHVVPSLNQILMRKYHGRSKEFLNSMTNNVSAINTGFFGLGSILGPILASVLSDVLTFRWSFTIISMPVAIICIIQFIAAFSPKYGARGPDITLNQ